MLMHIAPPKIKKFCLLAAAGMLVFMSLSPAAFAGPGKAVHHAPGKVISRLPAGHRVVHVGKSKYYVHGSHFYVKKPVGFVAVRAPLGAVVVSIPIGARAVLFGGVTFYVSNDVYYRKVPGGYRIVERPSHAGALQEASPVEPSQRVPGKMVKVQAHKLNVRSGPGLNFPVVHQVRKHQTLSIHGYAPEWLYVEMTDGTFGWVMLKYTSAYDHAAAG